MKRKSRANRKTIKNIRLPEHPNSLSHNWKHFGFAGTGPKGLVGLHRRIPQFGSLEGERICVCLLFQYAKGWKMMMMNIQNFKKKVSGLFAEKSDYKLQKQSVPQ